MNGTMEYLFRVKEIDHKKVAGYYYLRSNTSTQLPCQYGDICQFTGELDTDIKIKPVDNR